MNVRYFHEIPDFILLVSQTFLLWLPFAYSSLRGRGGTSFCFLATFTRIVWKHCFLITDNLWQTVNPVVSLSVLGPLFCVMDGLSIFH